MKTTAPSYVRIRTNGPRTKAETVSSATSAETRTVTIPTPRIKSDFTCGLNPGWIFAIVPVVCRPSRTRPPSREIDQGTSTASPAPVLVIFTVIPKPPAISPTST